MAAAAGAELFEREAELARIESLIGDACSGSGRLLVVEGAAGIGKSRLLQVASELAGARGMRVLRARGSELEDEFPFGIVRQLLEPLLAAADATERRRLLRGAAGFAAPLLGFGEPAAATERATDFAVLHGLYWLVSNLCGRAPVALVVDDVHWADGPSLRVLAFLLPRLEELRLLVALASRPPTHDPQAALLGRITTDRLAELLRPAPLSEGATAALMRVALSDQADDELCGACHQATGGNPFFLHELARALLAGAARPRASEVRKLAPTTVSRAVLVRLSLAGAEAERLARAVAVLGDRCEPRHASALAMLDRGDAATAEDALVEAGVLAPGRPFSFEHPIVHAAVYSELAPRERAEAHERAARLLSADGAPIEAVAAHLLESDPGGDAFVVEALRKAGRVALGQGAAESAVSYLRRALTEPPAEDVRTEVERELGLAELRAFDPEGIARLGRALERTRDAGTLAACGPLLAETLVFMGRPQEAIERLERMIAVADGGDEEAALALEAELIMVAQEHEVTAALGRQRLERLAGRLDGRTPVERVLLATLARERAQESRSAAETATVAEHALAQGRLLAEQTSDSRAVWIAVWVLLAADRLDSAEHLIDSAIDDARARGSVPALAFGSAFRSHLAYLRGRVAEAEAEARLVTERFAPYAHGAGAQIALAYLLDALLERGELGAAEQELERAGFAKRTPTSLLLQFARARLRLAQGKTREGVEELLEIGARKERWGNRNPFDTPWGSTAAVALAWLGDREEARRLVEEELRRARDWGTARTIGVALRGRALVERGERGVELLREAVAVLEPSQACLEHARALTDLGAALRRLNRRSAAREPLREGLELARRCGARALARQAHEELAATGERVPRLLMSGVESLTPSERRIAEMAARGLTNPQIAQALFLSPKTVEAHLGRAYRKLDIGSRAELAPMLRERSSSS